MGAIRYGTRINLQHNQILNAIIHHKTGLDETPTAALRGAIRFNTGDGRLYICDGTAWNLKATNSDALQGLSPAQLRDRSTHTGQQPASTISDLRTVVGGYPLNEHAAPTAAVAMGSQKITGLADGTASTDAVNKSQLDAIAAMAANGIAIKQPVLAVATGNISLTTITTIDGVTIPTNGRFLLAGQTDATQNGIYIKNASNAAVRATDADAAGELAPGTQVFVTGGTVNADTAWAIVSDATITPGTDAQTWTKVPGQTGSSYTWGNGLLNTSNTISVKPGIGITVSDGSVNVDTSVVVRKNAQAVPSGQGTVVTISHGLNTADILAVQVRDTSGAANTGDLVECGATVTGVNTIQLEFDIAPTTNQYRVAIAG
ncbi:hypothetical protein PBI_GRAY_118 [Gordonia phage Gray]|nr:hypothetical protein PBI_GRAY_118 [Gordonia phage Gray]WAA20097.1 hypothetical protein SEA_HANEM_120 [Gordonia phage Hanem]